MLLSIGDLVDKLVIENMKIFSLRDKLHFGNLTNDEAVEINEKMMILNENRGIIAKCLDEKIDKVLNKTEKNVLLKSIKTYGMIKSNGK